MPNEFFTLDVLATLPGITSAVVMLVQLLKNVVDNVYKFPTKYLSVAISLIVMFITTYFTIGITPVVAFLNILNSVVVAFAAMKVYEELNGDDFLDQ